MSSLIFLTYSWLFYVKNNKLRMHLLHLLLRPLHKCESGFIGSGEWKIEFGITQIRNIQKDCTFKRRCRRSLQINSLYVQGMCTFINWRKTLSHQRKTWWIPLYEILHAALFLDGHEKKGSALFKLF